MKIKLILFALLLPVSAFSQSLDWQIADKTFSAGDTVTAEFRVFNFVGIGAFQFAMQHDTGALAYANPANPFQFTGTFPGLNSGAFSWYGLPGYGLQPGEMRAGLSTPYGITIGDGSHIFSVVFVAKSAGKLSQFFPVWVNHPVLKPAAYTATPLQYLPFNIAYVSPSEQETTGTDEFEAQQFSVYPNPASGAFFVDVPAGVTMLRFYNADSRILWALDATPHNGKTLYVNSEEPPGLYFLEASGKEGSMFVKQVIKK
jgi:hypothetical protein